MKEEKPLQLLRQLRMQEAMRLAKEHDERVRQVPRELTDEEIVQMVREVREELFKSGYPESF